MTADPRDLLDRIADVLERARIPYALIGAAAMALHGISRSTLDIDVLVADRRPLGADFWPRLPDPITLEIRRGDAADPLAGVVRCRAPGLRDVDVIVGKHAWQAEIVSRAQPVRRRTRELPLATVADLILLKLYAGGSQDRWDIEQLLSLDDRSAITTHVEARLPALPASATAMWRALLREPGAS